MGPSERDSRNNDTVEAQDPIAEAQAAKRRKQRAFYEEALLKGPILLQIILTGQMQLQLRILRKLQSSQPNGFLQA